MIIALRIGKYVWDITPEEMPMDELKALKEYLDDTFEVRESEKGFWLGRLYYLLDEMKAAGFQLTYTDDNIWSNITVNQDKLNIEIKEEWVT